MFYEYCSWAQVVVLLMLLLYWIVGTGYIQVLNLGRASRTKETLPDFREKCRVTRHSRVFRGLTGSQRTLEFLGVTLLGCLNYSSDFIKDLVKERQELEKLLIKKNQTG